MGRTKREINPKRGERLKVILEKENISQIELAHKINIHPVNISKIINGNASLTEYNAAAIVGLYPKYPLEWLLGYGRDDLEQFIIEKTGEELISQYDLYLNGIAAQADLSGFKVIYNDDGSMLLKPEWGDEKRFDNDIRFEFVEDVTFFLIHRLETLYERGH